MKFSCMQPYLSDAVNTVFKAVSSKSPQPILAGIYIEASDNTLRLIGNDLNFSIEMTIEADVLDPGTIVIPARLFSELLRKLPAEPVLVEVSEAQHIKITCASSHYTLIGLPGEEYPEPPVIHEDSAFLIDKALFSNMIRQTHFAISQDESRPILTGALLEIENGIFNMVALDGFRMAIKSVTVKTDIQKKAVVPGRTLSEINKLISSGTEHSDLKISMDERNILFASGNIKASSRLLAGEYINYNQIIPNDFKSVASTQTDLLTMAIDRSFLVAKENKNVAIKLDIKDDYLTITSVSEMGDSTERVRIQLEGQDIEIGFNPKYLLDALRVMDSERLIMKCINGVSPCIIKPSDSDTYMYLVLPCRISR